MLVRYEVGDTNASRPFTGRLGLDLPYLLKALGGPHDDSASLMLAMMDPAPVAEVAKLLQRGGSRASDAMGALWDMGPKATAALPAIRQAFRAHRISVTEYLASFRAIGTDVPGGFDDVVGLTRSSTRTVRLQALETLPYFHSTEAIHALDRVPRPPRPAESFVHSAEAMQALIAALRHPDPETRRHMARVLGKMGAAAKGATMALREALQDPDPSVSAAAAEALRLIGGSKLP